MREIKFEYVSKCIKNAMSKNGIHGCELGEIRRNVYTLDEIQAGTLHIHHLSTAFFELIARRQFIGIKDDNGIEIYEGDILRVKNEWDEESIHTVTWGSEYDYPAFDLHPLISEEVNSISEILCGTYDYEVIGNIYENPELLKEVI